MSGESRQRRLYRRLLRLYPAAFRARFGDEMVQLFGDQIRDARTRGTGVTLAETWLRTLWDLAATAPGEHRRARTVAHSLSMPPTHVTRVLGLLGILGGGLLLGAWVPIIPWDHDSFNLRLVLFNVGAMSIAVAVHRRQAPFAVRLSTISTGIVILANAWYLVMVVVSLSRPIFPEPDPEFRRIFYYAAVTLWLSDALFGAVALALGTVSRWGSLSLMIGSLLAGSFHFFGGPDSPIGELINSLSLVGIFLVGVGWVWLGVDVATRRRPIPSPTSQGG